MTDVNKLITDNIDVWTSAIKKCNSQGRGTSKKIELTGIKKLRELILELAVRGKLVPQDTSDESASVLLKRIDEEKVQLIADKKIKKPTVLPAISDEEKPFELPIGWAFERLGNCTVIFSGSSFKSSDFNSDSGVRVIKITNAGVGKLIETNAFLPAPFLEKYQSFQVFKNDIILALTRPYINDGLKVSLCPDSYHESLLNQRVAAIRAFQYPEYLFLNLRSPYILNLYKNRFGGNGLQPNLKVSDVTELVIAVPPLAEQHRIVAKVDELMVLCDQLEQQTEQSLAAHQTLVEVLLATLTEHDDFQTSWQRIVEHFDLLFTTEHSIEKLKQTILQLAVMGKLVPQNPSDEPASVLLEKIAEEKAQLIADKKIKKQKPLPAITVEEKPFEIPEGWEWCRLPDLGDLARGKSKHRPRNDPKLYVNGKIPLIQTGDVARSTGIIETYSAMYNETGLAQSHLWPKGTLCITIAANIADTGVLGFDACFPDSVVGYTPFESQIPTKYFDYFIRTAKANLEKFAPSTAQKNINLEILGQVLVPCPPLNEFLKIVERIDSLMALCEQLKARLSDAQTTQLQLADAVVENALSTHASTE